MLASHRGGPQASVVAAPGPWSTGPVVVVRGLHCPTSCGIFPDQGSDVRLLRWQADALPPDHQGSRSVVVRAVLLTGSLQSLVS